MGKVTIGIHCPSCGGTAAVGVEKGKKGRGIIYSGECNHCQNRVSGKFNGKGFENISVDKN